MQKENAPTFLANILFDIHISGEITGNLRATLQRRMRNAGVTVGTRQKLAGRLSQQVYSKLESQLKETVARLGASAKKVVIQVHHDGIAGWTDLVRYEQEIASEASSK